MREILHENVTVTRARRTMFPDVEITIQNDTSEENKAYDNKGFSVENEICILQEKDKNLSEKSIKTYSLQSDDLKNDMLLCNGNIEHVATRVTFQDENPNDKEKIKAVNEKDEKILESGMKECKRNGFVSYNGTSVNKVTTDLDADSIVQLKHNNSSNSKPSERVIGSEGDSEMVASDKIRNKNAIERLDGFEKKQTNSPDVTKDRKGSTKLKRDSSLRRKNGRRLHGDSMKRKWQYLKDRVVGSRAESLKRKRLTSGAQDQKSDDMLCYLQLIKHSGKIEKAAFIDFHGGLLLQDNGMGLDSCTAQTVVHVLDSIRNMATTQISLFKVKISNKDFVCFRHNSYTFVGTTEGYFLLARRCECFVLLVLSDPNSRGSCITHVNKFVDHVHRASAK